jgi:thiol-disulfide isomerase/thioredoxin
MKDPYKTWYEKNYNDHNTSKDSVELLRPLLKNVQVLIFMGTWCGDSRREVPAFIKILESAGFPEKDIELVMVSNHDSAYKLSPGAEEKGEYIFRVPTFIFKSNGKETGRIVESPVVTLENDMISILKGSAYNAKYPGGMSLLKKLETETLESLRAREDQLIAELKPVLVSRSELNSIGYVLRAQKKMEQSQFVLDLNERIYPTKKAE